MRIGVRTLLAVGLAACAASRAPVFARQVGSPSTKDGIYTQEQAARGATVYAQKCASCHGPDLEGLGQAPALAGKDFVGEWIDMTVGDLSERVRLSMPADAPGSLGPAELADVLAFMLAKSEYPAGQSELPPDLAVLRTLRFVPAR